MPDVPQRKISYGELQDHANRLARRYSTSGQGTKTYPEVRIIEPRKGSKNGPATVTKLPKA
jgi:hypothetical protein